MHPSPPSGKGLGLTPLASGPSSKGNFRAFLACYQCAQSCLIRECIISSTGKLAAALLPFLSFAP